MSIYASFPDEIPTEILTKKNKWVIAITISLKQLPGKQSDYQLLINQDF